MKSKDGKTHEYFRIGRKDNLDFWIDTLLGIQKKIKDAKPNGQAKDRTYTLDSNECIFVWNALGQMAHEVNLLKDTDPFNEKKT